jgi:hypothetical protein
MQLSSLVVLIPEAFPNNPKGSGFRLKIVDIEIGFQVKAWIMNRKIERGRTFRAADNPMEDVLWPDCENFSPILGQPLT